MCISDLRVFYRENAKMSSSLRSVLEKMDNVDSDYRYMAARDLTTILKSSNVRADGDVQKKSRYIFS